MQFIVNVPDEVVPRVRDGYTGWYNYQTTITDSNGNSIPNPETKLQFIKRGIIEHLVDAVLQYESIPAVHAARTGVAQDIKQDIILT